MTKTKNKHPISPQEKLNHGLIKAIENNQFKQVEKLLQKGADVNARAKHGYTALMFASEAGLLNIAELLLQKGADVDATYGNGSAALMIAAKYGQAQIIELLIKYKVDIHAKKVDGLTPLMLAAIGSHADAAKVLLDAGVDPNAQECREQTALAYAAEKGSIDTIKILLKKGADINAGCNVICNALSNNHKDTIILLVSKGIDVSERKNSLLVYVAKTACKDNTESYLKAVEKLLEAGADVNYQDTDSKTALMYECINNNIDAIKLLLSYSPNLNLSDRFTRQAYDYAKYAGAKELLFAAGHKLDVMDKNIIGIDKLTFHPRQWLVKHSEDLNNAMNAAKNLKDKKETDFSKIMGKKEVLKLLKIYEHSYNRAKEFLQELVDRVSNDPDMLNSPRDFYNSNKQSYENIKEFYENLKSFIPLLHKYVIENWVVIEIVCKMKFNPSIKDSNMPVSDLYKHMGQFVLHNWIEEAKDFNPFAKEEKEPAYISENNSADIMNEIEGSESEQLEPEKTGAPDDKGKRELIDNFTAEDLPEEAGLFLAGDSSESEAEESIS